MANAAMGAACRHLRDLFGGGSVLGLGDGPLLTRYASTRDGAAFEMLVARHGPMVLATCRAVLGHEHDVEDAFQATFLVLAQKAGTVRSGEALGGWLHRVAYRSAVQASVEAKRRRRKEAEAAEASAMALPNGSRGGPIDELRPILHEEIDRLSAAHRLPVVLCDLEGLSYEEAAGRLGWSVPTLRCRLAKARQRLRDRLTRRGVSAGLALPPMPAVPAALARSAVAAATGGSASAGATILTHTILKGMFMAKLKIASTAALAALGLATAGVITAGSGRPEDPKPAMKGTTLAPVPVAAKDDPPPAPKPGETIEVRGRVVAPDGKPVAGATVRPTYTDAEDGSREVTSGPDGRFSIKIPARRWLQITSNAHRFPWLVASAPGFGPGHVESILKAGSPEPMIRLVEEGPPIEGRVVDLEGRPVARARVRSEEVWFEPAGDLAGWIEKARDHGSRGPWQGLMQLPAKRETETSADGRFRLAGFGRDRLADLLISGPTIATAQLLVQTGDRAEVRAVNREMMTPKPLVFHATKFEHAAPPTKPIEGVARDKDTGRPLAGVRIQGMVYEEQSHLMADGIDATTDDLGRYRVTGLPKAPDYRLFMTPAKGQPYTKATFRVEATSPALDPVAFDFALRRGVVVRGRVTDKATGLPATGYVNAYTFEDNPHVAEFPGYRGSYMPQAPIKADGRFEVVTLPGRGILACRSDDDRYRGAVGVESIRGLSLRDGFFSTHPNSCIPTNYHALVAVDLDPEAESATADLQVDPGRSVEIAVIDPEGRPIAGTTAVGLRDLFSNYPRPQESTIEVRSLAPGKPRRVIVRHEGRKLIGTTYLKGDEVGPLTIRLQPWGGVSGRVLDDEGRPRKGLRLTNLWGIDLTHPEVEGLLSGGTSNNGILVDNDGRFRVEGLVPGLKYGGSAVQGFMFLGQVFQGVTVAPGESRDLGDLKVVPRKPEADE